MATNRRMIKAVAIGLTVAVFVVVGALLGGLVPSVHAQLGTPMGAPLPGLNSTELNQFNPLGVIAFEIIWKPTRGLGPVFTRASCVACHASPLGGGGLDTVTNTFFGKLNSDGSFNPLTNEGGPFLDPTSIASQVSGCNLPGEVVPADATIVGFRTPPQTFGDGLIDSIPDSTILANAVDQGDGIHGMANMVPDVNGNLRPGRFGRKAVQPTLLQFVAQAFHHELGLTNNIFQTEKLPQGQPIPPKCMVALSEPNLPNPGQPDGMVFGFFAEVFLAPLNQPPLSPAAQAGQQVFTNIGCAKCHVPSMQTAANIFVPTAVAPNGTISATEGPVAPLSNQTVTLFSDLLLHDMGPGLADGIVQGNASASQWRTTPLWGLSTRGTYLHDGRTSDLTNAILSHGGEATVVVQNFSGLSSGDQANLLAFLNELGPPIAPVATLSTKQINFASQTVGTTSKVRTAIVTNTGVSALTISNVAVTGDFAESNNCPFAPATLAANTHCTLSVTFTPTALGTRTGSITITDNSNNVANSQQIVTLTGTGK